jgi:hypothetical protein
MWQLTTQHFCWTEEIPSILSIQSRKMVCTLWEFAYRILYEDKKRVKVVNKDPENLLVSWVPGGKTITEIFKEMNKGCRSVLYNLDSLTSIIQVLAHWSCHMLISRTMH